MPLPGDITFCGREIDASLYFYFASTVLRNKKNRDRAPSIIVWDPDLESPKVTDPSGSGSGPLLKRVLQFLLKKISMGIQKHRTSC
jgi:hypothetical protein